MNYRTLAALQSVQPMTTVGLPIELLFSQLKSNLKAWR
jgi:hypothetical protein